MDVRIGSSMFKALLDTGSSVSFFGPHAAAAAQASGAKPKADVRVLRLASGWSQSTMSLKCQIEWAAGCRRQQFLCVPDLCRDVVLGRDFLRVSGISLHVSLGGWTVGTEPQRIVPFVKAVKEQPEAVDDFGDSLRCIFAEGDASVCASVPEATAACNVIILGHSSDLDPRMKHILEEFSEIFTTTPSCTTLAEHRIDTGDNPPVRCKLRPVNSKKQAIMDNCIQDLLAQNLIRPSQSQHASAPVLIEKKSGGYRMTVDYRQLNARTKVPVYPMPRTDWLLAQLGRASRPGVGRNGGGGARPEKLMAGRTRTTLDAEVALMADKEALEDKVKGLDELQKIKEHLEAEVKALMETNEKMAQDFRDSQRKMVDSLEQLQHENGETAAAVEEFSHDVLLDLLGLRQDSRDLHFNTTHLRNRVAELDDEGVQKDMELQRLNGVCVNYASTIWALKAENERLYEGVTNFEQLASATTSDLEQAKSEIASLKEALAQAEAIPVEERERAAWLLLEKETHASELEKKLKELEEALEQLTKEKTDACDTANELRSLLMIFANYRSSRRTKVDHEAQTEESEKVDSFVQTEDGIMADDFDLAAELSPFPKMDTEVQTDTSDDEVFAKENESIIAKEKNACLALQAKVRELMNQVAAKSAEADKHQKTISSLQESFQSQLEEAQKNEQLKKAEVLKLKEKVRTLSFELNNAKETGARNLERMEKLYKEAKEEVQFMKKASAIATPGIPPIQEYCFTTML
ncbi:hypothetical protein MRX96_033816 [Rhipicephalus microplus]